MWWYFHCFWGSLLMVKSLDWGSFVPYFKGDRILLTRSKGKAWHWHEGCSSPTSCGFVKDKSCQTNLIFQWKGSRSLRGKELQLDCSQDFDSHSWGVPGARWGNMDGEKCCKVPSQPGNTLKTVCCLLSKWKDGFNTVLEGSVQLWHYSIFSLVTWVVEYWGDILQLLTIPSWEGL